MDTGFNSTTDVRPNTAEKQSQRKLRKEDILQEHREILSHLDDIMFRARAAMTKSSVIDQQIGDMDSFDPQSGTQHSGADILHDQSPSHPNISQSDKAIHTIPNQIQINNSNSQDRSNNKGVSGPDEYPSIIESQGSQHRSPTADQLRLAQIRLKKQQELLDIQQRQIHAMSQGSKLRSGHTSNASVGDGEIASEPSEEAESRIMAIRTVKNGLECNNSHESLEKSPKLNPDNRKPKLSGTDITTSVHKNYEVVISKENVEKSSNTTSAVKGSDTKDDELEKSLPPAEDFLKSLAEMKFGKQLTNCEGTENKTATKSNTMLNPQQLVQLGEHFKRLGIDTRPFQDLLGSPSNTREGKSTAFQPFERKTNVRKQLAFPENRALADGEEANSQARLLAKPAATAVVVPTPTERDSHSVKRAISQPGAISQGASFTPIEPYPVTTQSRIKESSTSTSRTNVERNPNFLNNISAGGSNVVESLRLNLGDLADNESSEHRERYVIIIKHGVSEYIKVSCLKRLKRNNKISFILDCRPKSSREHNRDKTLDERGGRVDGMRTARGRIERSLSLGESSMERAKLVPSHPKFIRMC